MASAAFVEIAAKGLNGTKGKRLEQICLLREAAIAIIQNKGTWEPVRCGDREVRIMCAKHGKFSILYKTPFQQLWNSISGAPKPTGYLLDVRHADSDHKKVLSLHWDEGGPVIVVAFRRGDWEVELLAQDTTRQQAA